MPLGLKKCIPRFRVLLRQALVLDVPEHVCPCQASRHLLRECHSGVFPQDLLLSTRTSCRVQHNDKSAALRVSQDPIEHHARLELKVILALELWHGALCSCELESLNGCIVVHKAPTIAHTSACKQVGRVWILVRMLGHLCVLLDADRTLISMVLSRNKQVLTDTYNAGYCFHPFIKYPSQTAQIKYLSQTAQIKYPSQSWRDSECRSTEPRRHVVRTPSKR
jgi:hypothetical protein